MAFTLQADYPEYIGRGFAWCGPYVGPKSYATGGDPVVLNRYNNYIDSMHGSVSLSGTYLVRPVPSQAAPRRTWKVKWIVISTGNEVANTTDLSGETVILDGLGGVF